MARTTLAATAVASALVCACVPATSHPVTQDAGEGHAGAPAAPRWPDDAHYALDLRFERRRAALAGTERITFTNVGPDVLGSVWIRAWGNAFGGCRARRVRIALTAGGALGARRRSCTALEVRLAQPLAPGARATLGLRVRITAPRTEDRFGRFRGAVYFGNAIPILAVAERRGWQLPPYALGGESFYSLTSAWRVRLRAPPGLRVASTGTQAGPRHAGVVTLVAPRARDFMVVVGRFNVRTARVGTVRLRRFSFAATPPVQPRRTLEVAALSMRRYAAWYGPYGRPEVDLVDSPAEVADGGVAMEYPELVLTPASASAIAHELAHQWFYGIVGDDQWREPWLDESFAEFSAARLPPSEVPNRLRGCRLPNRASVPLDSTMARFEGHGGRYVRTVYVGGACFLRALRRALGRARFDAMMRELVARHRDGIETTGDFVSAARAAAPHSAAVEGLLRRTGLAS